MSEELKIIKKKYGESMMHFCRSNFSSLLETEGLLLSLILRHFYPSHDLFSDIKEEKLEGNFKNYIYSLVDVEKKNEIIVNKTPKELLREAGYSLYECTKEKEIQSFKKYYAKEEELCTFDGGRLEDCYVFFAVKKDVEKIKREDYKNPKRQDKYGTSVISIQFTKDENHTLSIKNRYNHTVNNPDATFSNNLENIIPGLTQSFENTYGLVQKYKNGSFEIPNYTRVKGKYYKFNYEIRNTYYCPNNIIISNFEAGQFQKEKYIIMDYFILDLVNKKVTLYDERIKDSFPKTIGDIEKIKVNAREDKKEIYLTPKEGEDVVITLDKENHIIGYKNENVKEIGDNFLLENKTLTELSLSNVKQIGDEFLSKNKILAKLSLPNVKKIGNFFLSHNKLLEEINLLNVEKVGSEFLRDNDLLTKLSLPKIKVIKNEFLSMNGVLTELSLPKLERIGNYFLNRNDALTELSLPSVVEIGDDFIRTNRIITKLFLPKVKYIGNDFLSWNEKLEEVTLLNVRKVGYYFLYHNNAITKLSLPKVKEIGGSFLKNNHNLNEVTFPIHVNIDDNGSFIKRHKKLFNQDIEFSFLDYFKRSPVKTWKYKEISKAAEENNMGRKK